jgi:hypothetical protein
MEKIAQEELKDRYADARVTPEEASIIFQNELQQSDTRRISNEILNKNIGVTNETYPGLHEWSKEICLDNFSICHKVANKSMHESEQNQENR